MLEQLIILSTYLIAVAMATERLVAFVKSIIPWLAKERMDTNGLVDVQGEKLRSFLVLSISLLTAWITVSFLNNSFDPTSQMCLSDNSKLCWPAGVIALLSTGGSAFWSNILGYANAVKDIKRQQRDNQRLDLVEKSTQRGMPLSKLSIR